MAMVNVTAHTAQTFISQFSVSQISRLESVHLPEVVVSGIPWIVEVRRIRKDGDAVLGIFLYCGHKDKTSHWTYVATASFKLISFDGNHRAMEFHSVPHVFDRSRIGFGANSFIKWADLFKARHKFVRNDTIELEIKIKAEDPNHLQRSILLFENIDQSCDCNSTATYRLTVLNVTNLMAVATPSFKSRGLLWNIIIFKEHSSSLGMLLQMKNTKSKNVSCEMTMSVKLVSSNQQVGPIERFAIEQMQWPKVMYIRDIVMWTDLIKPGNGYINQCEDSIVFEVELKSEKPNGAIPNDKPNYPANLVQMECAVCLECIVAQDISCTPCGHMFCTACITANIKARGVCPSCDIAVESKDLRRLFLPNVI